jgi:hypothetical protein
MKDIIKGAYDLHIHSAPDVLPRKADDLELAQRVIDAGMQGYALKSHYFCTSERAEIIRKVYPGCNAIGAITLNSSVGGINPSAVELAARSGVRIVWFPTCDSEYEQKHVFVEGSDKKLPFWARIIIQMKEAGISAPTINLLDVSGKLKREVCEVVEVIAKNKLILATGHISHEETFALVKEAHRQKVERIVITHVDFPSTFYSIDEQKELLSLGAYMEHCYTTFYTGKVNFAVTTQQIRAIGPERVICSTDLGQPAYVYPDEGLLDFAVKLHEAGFTEKEIGFMFKQNCETLVSH